jgi:hypothetical protein
MPENAAWSSVHAITSRGHRHCLATAILMLRSCVWHPRNLASHTRQMLVPVRCQDIISPVMR